MKILNKVLVSVFSLAMLFALAACSNSSGSGGDSGSVDPENSEDTIASFKGKIPGGKKGETYDVTLHFQKDGVLIWQQDEGVSKGSIEGSYTGDITKDGETGSITLPISYQTINYGWKLSGNALYLTDPTYGIPFTQLTRVSASSGLDDLSKAIASFSGTVPEEGECTLYFFEDKSLIMKVGNGQINGSYTGDITKNGSGTITIPTDKRTEYYDWELNGDELKLAEKGDSFEVTFTRD